LLNYFHLLVAESGCAPPPYPSVFIKPKHALADAFEDIPVTKIAHETLDFEGELVSVILLKVYYHLANLVVGNCHWKNWKRYSSY
jgi:2-keto-4-pentenoate hydratase/2-oxohepta-3-ene-1,7-dioic acid hydratase in catechol pathway